MRVLTSTRGEHDYEVSGCTEMLKARFEKPLKRSVLRLGGTWPGYDSGLHPSPLLALAGRLS